MPAPVPATTDPISGTETGYNGQPVFTTRLIHLYYQPNVHVIPADCIIPANVSAVPQQRIIWLCSARTAVSETIKHLDIPILSIGEISATEAILSSRIVAFRASEEQAPAWLSLCLRTGRIPVLTGNAITLPFADRIDYRNTVFILGEEPVELKILKQLASIKEHELEIISRRCMEIWNNHYTQPEIEKQIGEIRAAYKPIGKDLEIPSEPPNQFPAFTPDGQLIRENDLMRAMWLELGRQFPPGKSKPIICLGAGRFLKRLLDCVDSMPYGPRILGIADDNATEGQTLNGIPVRKPSDFLNTDFSAVLLATDSIEDRLAERCRKEYGKKVEIIRPSQRMTTTPSLQISGTTTSVPSESAAHQPKYISPPGKMEAVIVCVNYGDILSWTLPWNREQFDNIAIVTSSTDTHTQEIARQYDAKLIISDRYRDNRVGFNKGKMLNDGIAALDMDDWILITDADILFLPNMRKRVMQRMLHTDCLYYATRMDAPEKDAEKWLASFMKHPQLINTLPFTQPGRNRMPWGYFQLINAKAANLAGMKRRIYSEEFGTACDVDYAFQDQWHPTMKILLPELTIHIPHGSEGTNWSEIGRASCRERV